MAYTTINKSTDYFNTKLYTGNGADGNAVTNVGHSPDFVWIKQRNSMSHRLYDKIRGVNSALISNESNAEDQYSAYGQFESFDSDGFTVGAGTSNGHGTNENGQSIVSWNWKANGAGSANTDGAVSTTVSVNTTAGFSIVKYTGTGTTTNFGHGLGVKPNVILIKSLSSNDWVMNGDFLGSTTWQHKLILNTTAAKATANNFNDQAPTNSVFYLNSAHGTTNGSGTEYIAYCFAEKTGYSKFGSYIGNGNADGTFVYTGFKPAFLIAKETGNTRDWVMVDNKRPGYNVVDELLVPNSSGAEITGNSSLYIDLISNGCKIRGNNSAWNNSGGNYIFMAFAEAPLVGSNNVPCTAR